MPDLLEALSVVTGEGGLLTGDDVSSRAAGIWNPEGIRARAIVRPRNTEEVSRVLALCHEARQPVVTHGGLTGLVGGALTEPEDIVLSLERLTAIEAVDNPNRTVVVGAGATLQAVQEAAQAAGLEFTLDLGARGSATLGGILATNAGGMQVIRFGMAREQVLGLEAVLADGTVLSSMNRMLKNNAGYDLKQLFIGSEGTLGVITRAVLRLRAPAAGEELALAACDSLAAVVALLNHVDRGLGGDLAAYEVMWRDFYRLVTDPPAPRTAPLGRDHSHYVLIGARGSDPERDRDRFEAVLGEALERELVADAVLAQSGPERDALWAMREDVERAYVHGPPVTFDVSLPIADMEAYVETVRERLAADWEQAHCWVFGHLGDGNLHIVIAVGDDGPATRARLERIVYEPLAAIGGSISAEHGIGLEKKPWLHLSRSAAEIEVMRRLKASLDPHRILNAGRIFDPA